MINPNGTRQDWTVGQAVSTLAILTNRYPNGKKNTPICKTIDALMTAIEAVKGSSKEIERLKS